MRVWKLSSAFITALALGSGLGIAGEAPDQAVLDEQDFQKRKAAKLEELRKARAEGFDKLKATVEEMKKKREEASKPQSGSVTVDEETKTVEEPGNIEAALGLKDRVRDEYEISPDDFKIYEHDRWTINLNDFRFDEPQYFTLTAVPGADKNWFGFTFSVSNSTAQKRRIAPLFTLVTNKGVFRQAVGGFGPERLLADSTFRPLADSANARDKELLDQRVSPLESPVTLADYARDNASGKAELSPLSTFAPGQTRWGAALWANLPNDFTEIQIVVHGLCNSHRYDEKLRRALVLTFERSDDEFNTYRTSLTFKEKQWKYMWMWDQDVTVPIPSDPKTPQIKVSKITTPAGTEKLMWAFPYSVKNSTRANQEFAIRTISYSAPVEVEVGGQKIPVEARVVDDGRSTIYKSAFLKTIDKPESPKDRFENKLVPPGSKTMVERHKFTIEPGKTLDENVAVFDEADVDWGNAFEQIESALTDKQDRKELAKKYWDELVAKMGEEGKAIAGKNPGLIYDPRRKLSDDEKKQVKEQVTKSLAGALDAAKAKKTVVAYFDCVSGLSTGDYRISRSYRQPGVVDETWLKAYEELDNKPQ